MSTLEAKIGLQEPKLLAMRPRRRLTKACLFKGPSFSTYDTYEKTSFCITGSALTRIQRIRTFRAENLCREHARAWRREFPSSAVKTETPCVMVLRVPCRGSPASRDDKIFSTVAVQVGAFGLSSMSMMRQAECARDPGPPCSLSELSAEVHQEGGAFPRSGSAMRRHVHLPILSPGIVLPVTPPTPPPSSFSLPLPPLLSLFLSEKDIGVQIMAGDIGYGFVDLERPGFGQSTMG